LIPLARSLIISTMIFKRIRKCMPFKKFPYLQDHKFCLFGQKRVSLNSFNIRLISI